MASTLHVLDKRDSTYAQIEKDTKPNSPERERKKLHAVLDMLEETGWLQTEQANTWHAYSGLTPISQSRLSARIATTYAPRR